MPLVAKAGQHFEAICEDCPIYKRASKTAEVCCKRESGEQARRLAITKLETAGWYRLNAGTPGERWLCPDCRRIPK
jgi:hypothetical protein